jgi:hypothetical protein
MNHEHIDKNVPNRPAANHRRVEVENMKHGKYAMDSPQISALGIVRDPWSTRWQASGDVEGVGWLEAWGRTLIEAMKALQALAAQRVTPRGEEERAS